MTSFIYKQGCSFHSLNDLVYLTTELHKYLIGKLMYIYIPSTSEYVAVWCEKNGGKYGEKDINDAVTEQISYARKKRKGNKNQ